jgi:MOSC domain-containing protein YiiM
MRGTIGHLNLSQGGIPKLPTPAAALLEDGLAGDTCRYPFHGGRQKAILLITIEGIRELVGRGFPVFPGALGENLTTCDLDRRALRVGQRFRVGEAGIELTQVRIPCATLDVYGRGIQAAIYDARVLANDPASPRWGLSGFYASVWRPGTLHCGDAIALCDEQPGAEGATGHTAAEPTRMGQQ